MGAWKCGCDIYYNPLVVDVTKPLHARDAHGATREAILMRLFTYSANGHCFHSSAQLARLCGMPGKQCEAVWNLCRARDVIRETPCGWSALAWMTEQGLYMRKKERVSEGETAKKEIPTPADVGPRQSAPRCSLQFDGTPNAKVSVAPCVSLTPYELEQLRRRYGNDVLNRMIAKLSEYKTRTGKQYQSDIIPLEGWIAKWIRGEKPKEITEIPEWI